MARMRSLRVRRVLRDVWHHKARTTLVVLAIAVGIVGAGAVLNTWSLLRRVTREGYLATNPASATLSTESVDADLIDQVRALPAIKDVAARRTVIGAALVDGSWRSALLFTMSDFGAIRIGTVQREAGAWPPKDGTVIIERSSVDYAGAAVGGSLTFRIGDSAEQTLPISGIARDPGLAPGWMEHVVYGFATPTTLALLGEPASFNQLQIVVRDGALDREAIRRVAYEVKAVVERSGRRVTEVEVPMPGRHIHAAQINSLLYTQGALGVLALLLSAFLVINLISAMLTGQVREIGVMKAIGAQAGQIAAMYLGLALFLGLVACIIAVPAAALIGRWYAEFTAGLLNFDTSGFSIPLWAVVLQIGVGALLPVAAASAPVIRGCRIPVSAALRDFGIDAKGGSSGNEWLGRVGGLTRPLLLSLRNAFRRRERMALTVLTLAMGGAVYLGALNLRTSIRNSVAYTFGALMRFDITVLLTRPVPIDSLEAAVSAVPGVARVEGWSSRRAALGRPGGVLGSAFSVIGLPPASRMVAYPVDSGRWLRAGDTTALVVSRRLLDDEPGLAVGGTVLLIIGGRPSTWTVVGMVESGVAASAYADRAALSAVVGDARVGTVVVTATNRDPDAQAVLSRRLRSDLPQAGFDVASGQLMVESRRVLEDHLLLVAGFLMVMSQAMIVVGGLGLASTMSLSVLERTREIGVLRAIGARHRDIVTMVQIEGLVISVASWALSIPLSIPMSVVVGNAFGRIMMPVRRVALMPNAAGMLVWLAVVVVVSVAACAWPAWGATRVTTAQALAYE